METYLSEKKNRPKLNQHKTFAQKQHKPRGQYIIYAQCLKSPKRWTDENWKIHALYQNKIKIWIKFHILYIFSLENYTYFGSIYINKYDKRNVFMETLAYYPTHVLGHLHMWNLNIGVHFHIIICWKYARK